MRSIASICTSSNPETSKAPKIINAGATLWILRLKTEADNVVLQTTNGGKTEVLGAHVYALGKAKTEPCLIIKDASASFAGFRQWSFSNAYYTNYVEETRAGITKVLPFNGSVNGILPLYTTSREERRD